MFGCNIKFIVVLCYDFLRNFLHYSIDEGIVKLADEDLESRVFSFCASRDVKLHLCNLIYWLVNIIHYDEESLFMYKYGFVILFIE